MKALLLILFFYSTQFVFSQNYLPLQNGNFWLFKSVTCTGFPPIGQCIDGENRKVQVELDSVMTNGEKYYFLDGMSFGEYKWVRTDSNWLYVYDEFTELEIPFLNFNAEVDSIYYLSDEDYPKIILLARNAISLFGEITNSLRFFYDTGFDFAQEYNLSKKYGLIGFGNVFYQASDSFNILGCVINDSTYGNTTDIETQIHLVPTNNILYQNYPNPFNPTTKIRFDLTNYYQVELNVFDIKGELVNTLISKELYPGSYEYIFNGSNLSSGVYFYQLKTDGNIISKKMIIMK